MPQDFQNALVVGGAGFIGAHLCEYLLDHNRHVICIDDYVTGHEENIDHLLARPGFTMVRHDITTPFDLKTMAGTKRAKAIYEGIHEIYHCALTDSPQWYVHHPIETLNTGIAGTKNVLDVATQYRAKVLFLSDLRVYGMLPQEGYTPSEDYVGVLNHLDPLNYYAYAKRTAEAMVVAYAKNYSLSYAIARVGTVYGPGMYLDDGRIVPHLIASALANKPLQIPRALEKGAFCFISDVVNGLEKVMASENSGIYNINHTAVYTYKELAEKIIALTKSTSKIEWLADEAVNDPVQKAWELHNDIGNIYKVKEETGWFPVVLLDEGLKKTIDFMKTLRGVKHIARR
ncbi:MAG: NAD-dependent epimerase/dehydratase family protein [bacterium]|nr:NAD-dependent epimerase/dehydratase family protein [bacterium]